MGRNCTRNCTCVSSGVLKCTEVACEEGLVCSNLNGTMGCIKKNQVPSCSLITCGQNSTCEVLNNQPTCIPNFKTCWVQEGSQYHTFDGHTFNFKGNCTYTLLKNCISQSGISGFSIYIQNEHDERVTQAFLKEVTLEITDYNITIARHQIDYVMVNSVKVIPPFSFHEGKVKVYYSGTSVMIELEFGLQMIYNWEQYLMIQLPKSFATTVCGMCGNNNGNPNDDFVTPDGTWVLNENAFGWSWKVDNKEDFCQVDCNGTCPKCDGQIFEKSDSCGLLSLIDGPFAACHPLVDPTVYQERCVESMCLNNGNQSFLCQALQAYSDTCQRSGNKVQDWRKRTECILSCPENSHYELCGSACQGTCSNHSISSLCQSPCVEVCQCNVGFFKSGGQCLTAQDCGCTYQGFYYPLNEVFWADKNCTQQCMCDPATKLITCQQMTCKSTESCQVVDGIQGCYPLNFKTCSVEGDPHYMTFDGLRYDFQGTCMYQLAALCSNVSSLAQFEVQVQNENRGTSASSYSRMIQIKAYGRSIEIGKRNVGKVLVDGMWTNLPYSWSNGKLVAYRVGLIASIQTDFGLTLTFDWNSRVTIVLPDTYLGTVCGLCGNFNGDSSDDLVNRNGKPATDLNYFGASWQTGGRPGCQNQCLGNCPKCNEQQKQMYSGNDFCGKLLDLSGPFRDCQGKIDPKSYFENCIHDVCLYNGLRFVFCNSISSYVQSCQDVGANMYSWRSKSFCDVSCPANSTYDLCAPSFPPSCVRLPLLLDARCREDCQCLPGFVQSGMECVLTSECGCFYDGNYYQAGDTFITNPHCQLKCVCGSNSLVSCHPFSCVDGQMCKIVNGILGCYPAESNGKCSVSGDAHYLTFDGQAFDFQGTCIYILAAFLPNETAEESIAPFSVLVQNVEMDKSDVSVVRQVELQIYSSSFILTQGEIGIIKMDGVYWNLPVKLPDIHVIQKGVMVLLQTKAGVNLMYDLQYYILISVSAEYYNQTFGLCGNFNGNPADDLQLSNGSMTTDTQTLGTSWKVTDSESNCTDGCGNDCPRCNVNGAVVFGSTSYCGLITASSGPFSACFSLVDPLPFFNDCVYDMCLSDWRMEQLCHSLQAYTAACQEAGGEVQLWRNETFCNMSCPTNSQYKLCTDTCAISCGAVLEELSCPQKCVEGCECNVGFQADGDHCVPVDSCGCLSNGRYYKKGESVLENNCTRNCTCLSLGMLQCTEASCENELVCATINAVMGCYSKDNVTTSCAQLNCSQHAKCEVHNNRTTCIPDANICWVLGGTQYHTFDGQDFTFQGNCTYELVHNCVSQSNASEFSVQIQIKHDKNSSQPYMEMISFVIQDTNITIIHKYVEAVMVNDIKFIPPFSLQDGSVKVYFSGISIVLEMNSGLMVIYNWEQYLKVKIPKSFPEDVCGMCGNNNNDSSDDFLTSNGTKASSAKAFGWSWKVDNGEAFCRADCSGLCPQCEERSGQIYETTNLCGVLTKTNGPFAPCHPVIDPSVYQKTCVNSMCVNNGTQSFLCQTLKAYSDSCQRSGIRVQEWRNMTGCSLLCSRNSHYNICDSPCTTTCSDAPTESPCLSPCVENCQCNDGFLRSGNQCVPPQNCGCIYQGFYYPLKMKFWTENCEQQCTCDPASKEVSCKPGSCKFGESCQAVGGILGCYLRTIKSCLAEGDPHYTTFDGRKFDFQGTCVYLLTGLCSKDSNLTAFEVHVQNENRDSNVASYARMIWVNVYGISVLISKDFKGKIKVNNLLVNLPYFWNNKTVQLYKTGLIITVTTDFGLRLTFDWSMRVTVSVPSAYAGLLCGLCGNYNDDRTDDASSPDTFGGSWKIRQVPGCADECTGNCHKCDENEKQAYTGANFCGKLLDANGPFRDCKNIIDPRSFFLNCVYDVCIYKGLISVLCQSISNYVGACQEAGATIYPWRSSAFCDWPCSMNSTYELCSSRFLHNCVDFPAVETTKCREDCECQKDFVISGTSCIPAFRCGCLYNGTYYQVGDNFFNDTLCKWHCSCQVGGAVHCKAFSCRPEEECRVEDGERKCFSAMPPGTCSAIGNSHFHSFDGLSFRFQGTCAYTFTKTCFTMGAVVSLTNFSLILMNKLVENGTSAVKELILEIYDINLSLLQNMNKVKVNGVLENIPFNQQDIWVYRRGIFVIIQADAGLSISYDLESYIQVRVSQNYSNYMCGLCGNFNLNSSDDFKLPNGSKTTDAQVFGTSWKMEPTSAKNCTDDCGKDCFPCSLNEDDLSSSTGACRLITEPYGPFNACIPLIDPTGFFNNCVSELCRTSGANASLCNSLQAYTAACQLSGVPIGVWRNASFCPMTCSSSSHYELCVDTCSLVCDEIAEALRCPGKCQEGCQCNDGYVFNGDDCVGVDECSCFDKGRTYKTNEKQYQENCTQKCWCNTTGGLSCEDVSCGPSTYCSIEDGKRGCYINEGTCLLDSGSLSTFDGISISVENGTPYDLVTVCDHSSKKWFRIIINFGNCNSMQPLNSALYVFLPNSLIVLKNQSAWVNGQQSALPQSFPLDISIYKVSDGLMVSWASDLKIHFRTDGVVLVKVKSVFSGKLCGACGNFNGNPLDDTQTNGTVSIWSAQDFSFCHV
ncbi:IgGFc-binding protein-like [Erpetoichthys calabaricus]|uniref:IgGFc-binding protein-like n=1 Tax=Erpetoichthys calabaricus TaxID=27687 RepID=UPI0022343492|nr:IgGFc-binding protein-like [Erpetoichthys calabaricus]